ncbi:MAG TPA: DinB family protein [Actinomycetota bacterium]|nr:DinB family protein [Actinomycetota bacterium]
MDFSLPRSFEVLRRTPATLQSMLGDLSDPWLTGNEGPGTWSPWEVVAHLTHVEATDWVDRTMLFLARDPAGLFRPVDREAGFSRFQGWPVSRILDRFTSLRAGNLETVNTLVQAEALGLTAVHPALGTVTLGQLLATWTVHDLNHLGQIVKAMAKQYGEAVGAWRRFLPILEAP